MQNFQKRYFLKSTKFCEKEINELVADSLYTGVIPRFIPNKNIIFSYFRIKNYGDEKSNNLLTILNEAGLVKSIGYGNCLNIYRVIFYKDLINAQNKDDLPYDIKEKFDNLVFFIKPKRSNLLWDKIPILNNYMIAFVNRDYLFEVDKDILYEGSFEIYTKLYNFYSSNGYHLQAKHAHYRANESYRKLLLAKGGFKNKFRARIFDGFILKFLAGHGDRIWNPIVSSAIGIFLFSLLFFLLNGIIVQGREAKLVDYLYFSLTIFTGYSFSNVQPDITIPLMQPLIMAESAFGLMMVALIIFVITYQISK